MLAMATHLRRFLLTLITAVFLTAAFFYLFYDRSSSSSQQERTAFFGTWTEEGGEPGNYIRFGLVWRTLPNNPIPGVQAGDGVAEFHKQLGVEKTQVQWNYESWMPLRLNVTIPGKCNFASIRMLDSDHLLIRFTTTIQAASATDVLEGPEVKRLTRVRDEGKVAE
jgi:hypothetical protein